MEAAQKHPVFDARENLSQRKALQWRSKACVAIQWKRCRVDPFEQLLVWSWNGPGLIAADPEYFKKDFWSTPGYAGCDVKARQRRCDNLGRVRVVVS